MVEEMVRTVVGATVAVKVLEAGSDVMKKKAKVVKIKKVKKIKSLPKIKY